MKALLYGIAALPFIATLAVAQPLQLSNSQMDKVNAGFSDFETLVWNSGATQVSIYSTPLAACSACYLRIVGPAISVQSLMPVYSLPTGTGG